MIPHKRRRKNKNKVRLPWYVNFLISLVIVLGFMGAFVGCLYLMDVAVKHWCGDC
jgi:preprotein translocase subunit SecE